MSNIYSSTVLSVINCQTGTTTEVTGIPRNSGYARKQPIAPLKNTRETLGSLKTSFNFICFVVVYTLYCTTATAFCYYAGSQNAFIKWINLEDTVILAEKFEFVSLFAYVLSADCIIIGTCWCLYIFDHSVFYGSFFRYLLFSFDFIFDMFYATFPLLLVGGSKITFRIAAASVNTDSILVVVATLLPIVYVTIKLQAILKLLSKLTQKQFYISFHFKSIRNNVKLQSSSDVHLSKSSNSGVALKSASISRDQTQTQTEFKTTRTGTKACGDGTRMQSAISLQSVTKQKQKQKQNLGSVSRNDNVSSNSCQKDTQEEIIEGLQANIPVTARNLCCYGRKYILGKENMPKFEENRSVFIIQQCRKTFTVMVAMIAIMYGIGLSSVMIIHTGNTEAVCNRYRINSDTQVFIDGGNNGKYIHLYAWDYCQYKVYPLWDDIPCQCRNLKVNGADIVNWYKLLNDSNGITAIFESSLKEYYMLETLYFGSESKKYMSKLHLSNEMLAARKLTVLQFVKIRFDSISDDFGLYWNNLQYLDFDDVDIVGNSTIDTRSWKYMTNLKWFAGAQSKLPSDDENMLDFLCHSQTIGYISVSGAYTLSGNGIKIPSCVSNMGSLRWIRMDYVSYFQVDVLLKPEMKGFTAYQSTMSTSNLETQLETIDNEHGISFIWDKIENQDIDVYLQRSIICHEFESLNFSMEYPLSYQFLSITQACYLTCTDVLSQLTCREYWIHDGMVLVCVYV